MSDANPRKRAPGRGARSTGPSSRRARGRSPRREQARPVEMSSTPVAAEDVGPADRADHADRPASGAGRGGRISRALSLLKASGAGLAAAAGPGARRGESGAAGATGVPASGDPRPVGTTAEARVARIRKYLTSAAGLHGVVLLLIISVAVVGVTVLGGGFTPLPATIASSWMLLNLGPFEYAATELGFVPALPAMALFAAVAWKVRREVSGPVSIRDVRTMAASFVGVPVVLTLIAWLMLWDASGVLNIDAPSLSAAMASTVAIHAGALLVGMGPRLTRALLRRRSLPEWPLASLRVAVGYVGWLWAAGAVGVVASLVWHHASVRAAFGIADGAGAVAGLGLLSLAYLPNIAVAAAGILVGAPANVGVAEAGLFAVIPGSLPPLPTLAAMPQSHVSPLVGVALVIPVAIAVWRVLRHLKSAESDRPYLEIVVAAAIAGVLVAVLAALMGGDIGQYGWSGANWWLAGVLASVWLAVPGAVVVVAVTGVPRTRGDGESRDDADVAPAPETAETEGEPEVTEPETAEPEAAEPETAEPEAAEPDATEPESAPEAAPESAAGEGSAPDEGDVGVVKQSEPTPEPEPDAEPETKP